MQDHQVITQAISQSYEDLPYRSHPFRETHPSHLATIGFLFGMSPPAVQCCRVLELGCASGGNLIPMAASLPKSQFVGIDLSPKQIRQGQEIIRSLMLTNIELVSGSLLEIEANWGKFDYIIAHGVYSWVPEDVRAKILTICRENLSDRGIAYVSYNAYPGWYSRGIIRDILQYGISAKTSAQEQLQQVQTITGRLAQINSQQSSEAQQPYNVFFGKELKRLENKHSSYIFHEYLASINVPFYFHEFISQAEQHHLQYLGEANFSSMFHNDLSPESQEELQQLVPDLIAAEQYHDFLRNRMFRKTLLCHKEVFLERRLKAEKVLPLKVSSSAQRVTEQPDQNGKQQFSNHEGASLCTSNQVTQAALSYLGKQYPEAVLFTDLWTQVADDLPLNQSRQLATDLLRGFSIDLLSLSVDLPLCTRQVEEFPVGFSLSREQAKQSQEVTNCCHEIVSLEPVACQILPYLDGSRDRAAIAQLLSLSLSKVESGLQDLARAGVLIR